MKLNRTGSRWDRSQRININDNWDEIERKYHPLLNLGKEAEITLKKALGINAEAKRINDMNVSVQDQLNRLVIESGNANAEVSQARDYHDLLYQRLEKADEGQDMIDVRRAYQSLVSKKTRKPMITWIDDDGHVGVYTKLAPLLKEYGIKMTSAIVTNFGHGFPLPGSTPHDSRFMSYEQMKELEDEGLLEYVCHTHTHDINNMLTQMGEEELHNELKTNQDIIKKLGWNHRHLVYPFGEFNDGVIEAVKKYFDSAFNTRGGTGPYGVGNLPDYPFNQFAISRVRLDDPSDLPSIQQTIDKAIAENKWVIIYSHVDQYGGLDDTKIRGVIEHALNSGLEFVSVEEGINEYGNLAQFADTTIDAKGDVHSNQLGVVSHIGDAYADIQDRSIYRDRKIHIQKVKSFEAGEYGLPGAGIMFTYKDNENAYDFRKFVQTNNNARDDLMSYFDRDAEVWSEWLSNSAYVYRGTKLTPDSPVSDFPVNTVTLLKVSNANAADYGLPNAGTVEVFRDRESNYSYQMFTPHSGFNLKPRMIRHYNSGTWTSWRNEILARRYERDLSGTLIPANSTRTYNTAASLSQDHTLIINPAFVPPDGLIYDVFVQSDGNLAYRFVNVTDSSIDLSGPWVVRVLET